MRASLRLLIAVLACVIALPSCSDESSVQSEEREDSGADAAAEASDDARADVGMAADVGAEADVGMAADVGAEADVGMEAEAGTVPVESCDELSATSCSSNYDCPQELRCHSVGADNHPVRCCVTGARGTGQAGEECDSFDDCESGFCVSTDDSPRLCSKPCNVPADCPATMSNCLPHFPPDGFEGWCFPF